MASLLLDQILATASPLDDVFDCGRRIDLKRHR